MVILTGIFCLIAPSIFNTYGYWTIATLSIALFVGTEFLVEFLAQLAFLLQ